MPRRQLVVVHKVSDHKVGEDSADLRHWLEGLEGCPPITVTTVASCESPVHDDEPPTWFYVEGDAREGVARRRCLACGEVKHVLDSAERWTHPPMHTCPTCGQSMFEMAAGFHVVDGAVDWLAIGLRCVGCGMLDGLTDMHAGGISVPDAIPAV
ncbi:MAG TPA: hypothetical protein VNA12_08600 [Mycobacteriales bacterium]|nr:hypothetical protein [Mycobacteriales bacterium]